MGLRVIGHTISACEMWIFKFANLASISCVSNPIVLRFVWNQSPKSQPHHHQPRHCADMERKQFECAVCAEIKDSDAFPSSILTIKCLHPSSTCSDCVSTSVNTEFETTLSTRISCPECPNHLGIDEVRIYLTDENYSRYVEQ